MSYTIFAFKSRLAAWQYESWNCHDVRLCRVYGSLTDFVNKFWQANGSGSLSSHGTMTLYDDSNHVLSFAKIGTDHAFCFSFHALNFG